MAPHPHFPLLDTNYDNKHRAHIMVDEGRVLTPLRIRTHSPMVWDNRFVPYLRRAGLLPLARMTQPQGWRDSVEEWLGLRPPEPQPDQHDTKPTGVSSTWLIENFTIDNDTNYPEEIVEVACRAWSWHLVGGYLFPDASGNTISWIMLPYIMKPWDEIGLYSWGSVVLAYLYRQLCQACRRTRTSANLGGCAYLLQVWMWERFPLARPERRIDTPWPREDEGSQPTIAYLYHDCVNVVGNVERRYREYINTLDVITSSQVNWTPYERYEVTNLGLSPMCSRDMNLWRAELPLIFFYAVKWHVPQRVMRQFGRLQLIDVAHTNTNQTLHKVDRRSDKGAVDWASKHAPYLIIWEDRQQRNVYPWSRAHHRAGPYKDYLHWLHQNSRLKLRPALNLTFLADQPDSWSDEEIVDDPYTFPLSRNCSGSRSRASMGKQPVDTDSESDDAADDSSSDATHGQDIIGASQIPDAPQEEPSQATPRTSRHRKNPTPHGVLPTNPGTGERRSSVAAWSVSSSGWHPFSLESSPTTM
ncbi:hypothetical protein QOZ80_5BG0435140 [Eleusine coracana subsp. coracana]|nr:hypothetical protein QOZ80_5BG0435140 [Eleusine coracana subsp. coracana]